MRLAMRVVDDILKVEKRSRVFYDYRETDCFGLNIKNQARFYPDSDSL